ncbi:MAG TPA: alpha/beta fold hydrolase [Acidimicrobiales bacterium]|nr:alpha/beta fold hydrolase [Acidimicrobiales bacterium]
MTRTPSFEPSAPAKPRARGRRVLLIGGLLAAGAAAGIARRRLAAPRSEAPDDQRHALGWGEGVARPDHAIVRTSDGAELAIWDLPGDDADSPVVVLPHCWGCSHEIWIPVARRLREQGYRVVLYDQRGHGLSSRGTAPLAIDTLAHDLEAVLEATEVRDVVLAGHSMGGFTVMSLATHRPEVFQERAKAVVLVATAATAAGFGGPASPEFAAKVISSRLTTQALKSRNGHLLVRSSFGAQPVRAHMELTRNTFANCDPKVRGDFVLAFGTMDLLEGIATIDVPTTVMVGTRDTLTVPKKSDQMVATIPGSRLVTLKGKGHMLPLEDPDAVSDEIVRAVKG